MAFPVQAAATSSDGSSACGRPCVAGASGEGGGLFEPPFFLARNHRLRDERAKAARLYARAARRRPEDYRACGLLAEKLHALGRQAEARACLEQAATRLAAAVERHPDNTDALAFGAAVHAELGNTEPARTWCRWAHVIGKDENLVQFNCNLARAHALPGEGAAALTCLTRLATVRARLHAWLATGLSLDPLRDTPASRSFPGRLQGAG